MFFFRLQVGSRYSQAYCRDIANPNWQHMSTVYEFAYQKETIANFLDSQDITWLARLLSWHSHAFEAVSWDRAYSTPSPSNNISVQRLTVLLIVARKC